MGKEGNRGPRHGPDLIEEARETAGKAFEIVKNYVTSEHFPETLSAKKLVALLRVTQLFPEKMKKKEFVGILSAMLPELGYSDTIFRRREFRKMPSQSHH